MATFTSWASPFGPPGHQPASIKPVLTERITLDASLDLATALAVVRQLLRMTELPRVVVRTILRNRNFRQSSAPLSGRDSRSRQHCSTAIVAQQHWLTTNRNAAFGDVDLPPARYLISRVVHERKVTRCSDRPVARGGTAVSRCTLQRRALFPSRCA